MAQTLAFLAWLVFSTVDALRLLMFVDWDPLSILFQDLDCRCHESDDRHLPHISPMHGLLDLCGSHTSASLCTVLAMTYATSMRANIGYTCPNISAKTRLSVAFEQLFLTLRESRLLTMKVYRDYTSYVVNWNRWGKGAGLTGFASMYLISGSGGH